MADEENRLRDRVGDIERRYERLDERLSGKLGKDDATMLMEYASNGDSKLREDVLSRMSDFRLEVREAFKHNEKETGASIYKAVTESEGRLTAAIAALSASIASLAAPPAAAPPPPQQGLTVVNRLHPAGVGVGAVSGASILYLVLAFLNIVPRP